jgi:antitoxin component of MazEF toxin-antitoxin module
MGFPTKIQLIKRAASEQWYINLPSAVAQAMEFTRGETVEWIIEDKQKMILKRTTTNESDDKKKLPEDS